MNMQQERPSRSAFPLWALLTAFVVGAVLSGWMVWRVAAENGARAANQPIATTTNTAPASSTRAAPLPLPSATTLAREVTEVAEQQGGLDQRLAAAEQRIARLDLQAQAATGNAARAEGLLIAFATRRALERGAELGYLGEQLRLRFGDALPNAVETVLRAGQNPITQDQLAARLDGLAPQLASPSSEQGWSRFKRELSELFVIRRASSPSPAADQRLERARAFLETGRIDAAIAEVQALPGADGASRWIRDARNYGEVQKALDLIETAAILEPRRLRDGEGHAVEQLSPAAETAIAR